MELNIPYLMSMIDHKLKYIMHNIIGIDVITNNNHFRFKTMQYTKITIISKVITYIRFFKYKVTRSNTNAFFIINISANTKR